MSQREDLKYHVTKDTVIVSLLESLASIVFCEDKAQKQMFINALEFKLQLLQPKAFKSEEDKILSMLLIEVSSYCGLDEYMIKNMQLLKLSGINEDLSILDLSRFTHNEETLKIICEESILPMMLSLGVDVKEGYQELDGMRNRLLLQDGIYL